MDVPYVEYGCVAARVLADARTQDMRTVFDTVSEESDRFSKVQVGKLG